MAKYASHVPALMYAYNMTSGPVLEAGMGLYSTHLLHHMCLQDGRLLISLEGDERWIQRVGRYGIKGKHEILLVNDWRSFLSSKGLEGFFKNVPLYGVAFIDTESSIERLKFRYWTRIALAQALRDRAHVVVIHDTEDPLLQTEQAKEVFDSYPHKLSWRVEGVETLLLSAMVSFTEGSENGCCSKCKTRSWPEEKAEMLPGDKGEEARGEEPPTAVCERRSPDG